MEERRRPRILVVGSFMMDLTATTKRIPASGETVIGGKFSIAPGGKGANQAVQCALLGADTTIVGQVGDDIFGKALLEATSSAGVDISNVKVLKNASSGVGQILLELREDGPANRITVCPGANYELKIEDISWLKSEINKFDMVLLQLELRMDVVEAVAEWAKSHNVPVMLNPAPAGKLSNKLLSCISYMSPNEHEAAIMSDHKINVEDGVSISDVKKVYKLLNATGKIKIIITLGDKGAVLCENNSIYMVPAAKIARLVDPTAAGDSFVASFCTFICAGLTEEKALRAASYAAALTVSGRGAMPSLPTLEKVISYIMDNNEIGFSDSDFDRLR